MPNLIIETHDSVAGVGEETWDELVGDGSPFLEYGFLHTLEEAGCLDRRSGWHTAIITAKDQDTGDLVGALPFYIKVHSRGEFVYDWGWAEAAARAGIDYYPKGVVAAPFTPVTGKRMLTAPGTDRTEARHALVSGAVEVAKAAGLSGVHFNFIDDDEVEFFEDVGMPIRTQLQYHWYNGRKYRDADYEDFDDYLAQFRSKRRANIRRERRKLGEAGVTTRVVQGDDLTPAQMRRMFRYYMDTITKFYWGHQYLNEEFFVQIAERLRDRVHLIVAEKDGEEFAGAFNLLKGDRLYGRYWGCIREENYAHFEVCMYRPVEWCIEHGIEVFEPGHGGEHKHERGFQPTKTYSAHWLKDPQLDHAIRDFLRQEQAMVDRRMEHLEQEESPLKA